MISKKEKTKENIIQTTVKLMSARGYNAATTLEIAKESGVSEAIIFKYYKNKANLLREVCTRAIGQIIENVSLTPLKENIAKSKDYPLKKFLQAFIFERFSFLEKNFEIVKILLNETQYQQEISSFLQEALFPQIDEIFKDLNSILVKKAQISELQASAILRVVTGTISSFGIQKFILQQKLTKVEMEKEVDEILNIVLKGIGLTEIKV